MEPENTTLKFGARLYIAKDTSKATPRKADAWFAVWRDHGDRVIRRRLGNLIDTDEDRALKIAFQKNKEYFLEHHHRLLRKAKMTQEQIDDMAQRANFPRAAVALHVKRICNMLVNDMYSDGDGQQLFSDRLETGGVTISCREIYRITKDEERISVGQDVVDKICCHFDVTLDDVIESAHDWANLEGEFANRRGSPDAWPVGYARAEPIDEDII